MCQIHFQDIVDVHLSTIIDITLHIVNLCFLSGVFPTSCKSVIDFLLLTILVLCIELLFLCNHCNRLFDNISITM